MLRKVVCSTLVAMLLGALLAVVPVAAPPAQAAELPPVFVTKWGGPGTGNGQFNTPRGIAVDGAGTTYVADTFNHRIQTFTSTGTYVGQWGTNGSGAGQFSQPQGVAVDETGHVYVADTYNHRIQTFTSTGTYLTQWGTNGTGNGQFSYPRGVVTDAAGNVYVADTVNHRIQTFTSTGTYLGQWGTNGTGNGQFDQPRGVAVDRAGGVFVADRDNHRIQKFTSTGTYVSQWGTYGTGDGQFTTPEGMAVDGAGTVYVADTYNHRVQKFESAAPAVTISKTADETTVVAGDPIHYHVTVTNTGNVPLTGVTVTDANAPGCAGPLADLPVGDDHTVDCSYTPTLSQLGSYSNTATVDTNETDPVTSTAVSVTVTSAAQSEDPPAFVRAWGSAGSGDGRFDAALGVAVGDSGDVYVADQGNDRVQRFSSSGSYLGQWGTTGTGDGQFNAPVGIATRGSSVYVTDYGNDRVQQFTSTGTYVRQWGTAGTDPGQFDGPWGITVDSVGHLLVTDRLNNRVQEFGAAGGFLHEFGMAGTGDGQFSDPRGIAVASSGDVYVADSINGMQRFNASFDFVGRWGNTGSATGQFNGPRGVSVDADGDVYVSDQNNHRIQKFSATGTFLSSWGGAGSGDGQFQYPVGNAVNGSYVYVVDQGNARVQQFVYDATDPTVDLRTPAADQAFTLGAAATADYSCDDTGGSGLDTCTGTIPDGDPLDTSTLGTYSFEVTATDRAGNETTVTHTYRIVGLPAHNGRIAFVSNRDGDDEIFTMNVDGSGQTQLTHNTAADRDPAWSPDGTHLVFRSNRDGNHELYAMHADGTDQTRLTTNPALDRQPAWSPDGGLIAFTSDRDGNDELYVMAPDGTGTTRLTTNGAIDRQAAWSPDGARIAFSSYRTGNSDVFVMRRDGTEVTQLTTFGDFDAEPAWSPDGTRIAFTSDRDGNDEIWNMAPDGSGTTQLTNSPPNNTGAKWSPDGTQIAFGSNRDGNGEIYRMNADGSVETNLTHAAALDDYAAWQPVRANAELAGTVTETGTGTALVGTWVIALRASDYGLAGGTETDATGRYSLRVDPGAYVVEFVDPAFSHIIESYDDHAFDDLANADPVTATAGGTTTVDAALDSPRGAVSGTITDADTGTALEDAGVAVLPVGVPRPLAAVTTDADGHYRLPDLEPGDYVVVSALAAGTHRAWFHGDTADVNDATPVTVTAGSTSPDVDIALPPVVADPVVGTITGTITDDVTGQPEAGALVGALRAADYRFTVATFTDDDGHYSLGVPAGAFYLEIFDLDTGHRFEWYDDQPDPGSFAELTTVTAAAVADAAMTPLEGTVAGTVTVDGTGTPLGGVWVALMGYGDGQPVAGTTTAADGTYTLPDVDIGDYYLVLIDPTAAHEREFHDDTPDMGAATPVTVTGGHVTTIDADLTRTS